MYCGSILNFRGTLVEFSLCVVKCGAYTPAFPSIFPGFDVIHSPFFHSKMWEYKMALFRPFVWILYNSPVFFVIEICGAVRIQTAKRSVIVRKIRNCRLHTLRKARCRAFTLFFSFRINSTSLSLKLFQRTTLFHIHAT